MKLHDVIKEQLKNHILQEEFISNNTQIGYHRTTDINTVKRIFRTGFIPGYQSMYGRGIYNTISLQSQLNEKMDYTYGNYIIKSRIRLNNRCLIFDKEYQQKVYGKEMNIIDQLKYFGIDLKELSDINKWNSNTEYYTSELAYTFITRPFGQMLIKTGRINAIEFTGEHDGKVIVVYNQKLITPMQWNSTINDPTKLDYDKWKKEVINKDLLNNIEDNDKNTKFNGTYYYTDAYGYTIIVKYKNNKKNGEYKEYYPNNRLYKIQHYKNDILDGKYEEYFDNGILKLDQNYKNGKLNGEWTYYNEDGSVYKIQYYKNGELDGRFEEYDFDGNLFKVINYKDGKLDGKYIRYDENGSIESCKIYKNDEFIKNCKEG